MTMPAPLAYLYLAVLALLVSMAVGGVLCLGSLGFWFVFDLPALSFRQATGLGTLVVALWIYLNWESL